MRNILASLLFCAATTNALSISVSVMIHRHSYCGRPSGYATAFVSGGVPPYAYNWSNGSTVVDAMGLFPGNYSLTVTDSQMDEVTENFTIDLLSSYGTSGASSYYTLGHCPGQPSQAVVFTGMEVAGMQPPLEGLYGPNPYSFSHPQLADWIQSPACNDWQGYVYNRLHFQGLTPGSYDVAFTDAEGCPGTVWVSIGPQWNSYPQVQVLNVTPSCASTATGSVTYSVQGDLPYDHLVKLRPANAPNSCYAPVDIYHHMALTPGTTRTVANLPPGDHWLIITNDVYNLGVGNPLAIPCMDSIMVTVPSLGIDCGMLTGRVYIDDVADCVMAGAENRIPGTIVEITPGPYYVTTNTIGQYSIGLNFGAYTVTEQHPVFQQSCPGEVTLASSSQTFNVGCAGGEPLDLQLAMSNGPARPGFQLYYGIALDNLTPASPGTVTLTVTLDPVLGFVSANPAPSSVVGNVLTWTAPQLVMNQVFQHRDISVCTQVPPDVGLIGSTLTTTAQLVTANTDGNLANNTSTSNQLVTGSFDPNDKLATTSTGSNSVWLINEDAWVDYTIRFQNTGTDTAFNVVITDTLPPELDPASITWGAGSHTHTRALSGQGVLKFIFPNILLPDSNVNEPLSHGFVSFRIQPHLPVAPGTVIENIANIHFDYNPPVITEPSVLVAEFSTGVVHHGAAMRLFPNPFADRLTVEAPEPMQAQVKDATGRTVRALRLGEGRQDIVLDGLAPGAYFLFAVNAGGQQFTIPIIKQ